MTDQKNVFYEKRLAQRIDELRRLYIELYGDCEMFGELLNDMQDFTALRDPLLAERDALRASDPQWYRRGDLLGMMLYIDNFAGTLRGVGEKLDYLEECGVNCLHLMPFLESPEGRSDGGYAVSDFRRVQPEFGTMDDLASLARACHARGMNLCMDFVMNHTSEEHEWAKRARRGEEEYRARYFFTKDEAFVRRYEAHVPQVFPTTAPGNFTWLDDADSYVMTTFYPYQWDLNYRNPRVFHEMLGNLLFLAGQGIDIVRLDAVPYIWKEPGTQCRNLPQVHMIVRMMRLVCEIVCPGVLLLGEVVMEPEKVAPYFGTPEKPECHMLYNVSAMAAAWHTVATKDIRLLRKQLDVVYRLPAESVFLNYLRCHDDIGWGLDYPFLQAAGMEETAHKRFLNQYFTGRFAGSRSRGELYNDDPVTQDARLCGTTASLCGVEAALEEGQSGQLEAALRLDLLLHALILAQPGVPMLYSGDEIGQLNDYSYRKSPDTDRQSDSRYLHRGRFPWELAARRRIPGSPQQILFDGIRQLASIRKRYRIFTGDANAYTYDVKNQAVLGILRENGDSRFLGLFNFSGEMQTTRMKEEDDFTDLLSGKAVRLHDVELHGYEFLWAVAQP